MENENTDFTIGNKNNFERLAELLIDIPSQTKTDKSFAVNAEVRFGAMHINGEKISFDVCLRQAYLQLNLNDCTIVRGSRFADSDAEKLKRAQQTAKIKSTSKLAGELTISKEPAASLTAGATGEAESEKTTSQSLLTVQALAGTVWRITEHDATGSLQGKFLGDENLCNLNHEDIPFSVNATLYCFPSDMKIDNVFDKTKGELLSKIMPLKKKCIEIFIAKAIRKRDEEIHLSESNVSRKLDAKP
jgi:hypothetical protein